MKQAALTLVLASAFTGCAGPNQEPATPSHPEKSKKPFESGLSATFKDMMDAFWDVIHKHKSIWLDEIRMTDEGGSLEQKLTKGGEYGVIAKCHMKDSDNRAIAAFRRDLKEHPGILRHFSIVLFDVSYRRKPDPESGEHFTLDFDVIMVSRK
jgi:hypothetical protein